MKLQLAFITAVFASKRLSVILNFFLTVEINTFRKSTLNTKRLIFILDDCLNENWEEDANGVCKPKAEYFTLSCNADGMEIQLNEAVYPDAATVFLTGENCGASYDFDSKLWSVNTTLDGCDTQMGTNEDGSLAFPNVLRLDAYSLVINKLLTQNWL